MQNTGMQSGGYIFFLIGFSLPENKDLAVNAMILS
jgi:hypothetical protein